MMLSRLVTQLKQLNPLVLNLTNTVSVEFVANGLLALGASPIMSESSEEIEALINISQALVINLGTLHEAFVERSQHACGLANQAKIPVILDPVGAGATPYRTKIANHLLKHYQIALVRGNASEIMALSGISQQTKGVDTTADSHDAIHAAKMIAQQYQCIVTVSGPTDIIVSTDKVSLVNEGHPLMPKVVGTGCLFSAVTAAFCAIHKDNLYEAAHAAAWYYGRCGALAAEKATGPGTFKTYFLDALENMLIGVHHATA